MNSSPSIAGNHSVVLEPEDAKWMRVALDRAAEGVGFTRPNPPVGAVVVRNKRCIGAGLHRRAGGAHAEIGALDACATSPRGATLYVTLEPCSTVGRTPPCTERLIREGLARVVVGTVDPNPRHAGRGLEQLRAAGVEVLSGVLESESRDLIVPFAKWIVHRRPWVTLKLAMTLDGFIADRQGRSKWITGQEARLHVQQWRRRRDMVMVGIGTALADDPSLRCRIAPEPPTLRLIVDGRGRLPLSARVLNDGFAARTVIATTRAAPVDRRRDWEARGATVWVLPARRGQVDLQALMVRVGAFDCPGLLCEGGASLAGALVKQGLVDEYLFFIAPILLADGRARQALDGEGFRLRDAPRLSIAGTERIGSDLCVRAYPSRPAVEPQTNGYHDEG